MSYSPHSLIIDFSKWSCHFCFFLTLTCCLLGLTMIRVSDFFFTFWPYLIEVVLLHNLCCCCLLAVFTACILLCADIFILSHKVAISFVSAIAKQGPFFQWICNVNDFVGEIFFNCSLNFLCLVKKKIDVYYFMLYTSCGVLKFLLCFLCTYLFNYINLGRHLMTCFI